MSLPILTTPEDIEVVCGYLSKRPMGASVEEMRAVLDSKYLDNRKLSALKQWGFVEETETGLKVTDLGRTAARDEGKGVSQALAHVIRDVPPYRAIVERAAYNREASLTSADVGAHWHEHFPEQVSSSEKTLSRQVVCFFRIAEGAGLGQLIIGRKGSPTRLDFGQEALSRFIQKAPSEALPRDLQTLPRLPLDEQEPFEPDTYKPARPELGQGIFIAHGKNKKPLEQLKTILDQFKIPYKVAIEEPNLGRPIGAVAPHLTVVTYTTELQVIS